MSERTLIPARGPVLCVADIHPSGRDCRAAARDVIRDAAAAAAPHGRLVLVAVLPPLLTESVFSGAELLQTLDDRATAVDQARWHLRSLAAQEAPGFESSVVVLDTRDPRGAIATLARDLGADLIVVPPGWGGGRLARRLFGSTADRLARATHCRVLEAQRSVSEPTCV